MKYYKISFCTVSMDRLSHIQKCLVKNILDNIDYPNLEFVLLDYNSKDNLGEWVNRNLREYIEKRILVYFKTSEPKHFNQSHSKNLCHKLATGDILCNLDADNYTGKGFAYSINEQYNKDFDIYLTPNRLKLKDGSGMLGRICLSKKDFIKVKGYDETLKGWGYEDLDLKYRVRKTGAKEVFIDNLDFLSCIKHDDKERIVNDKNYKCIHAIYGRDFGNKVECLYLFNNGRLERGTINRNDERTKRFLGVATPVLLEAKWKKGRWKLFGNHYLIEYEDPLAKHDILNFRNPDKDILIEKGNEPKEFKKVVHPFHFHTLIRCNNETKNFKKFYKNFESSDFIVNFNGFGNGNVQKNFIDEKFLVS